MLNELIGYDAREAVTTASTLIAEGADEAAVRNALHYVPEYDFKAIYNRGKYLRDALDDDIPPVMREAYARSSLNKIVRKNIEEKPEVAIKAIALIAKDPIHKMTARTAGMMLDENALAKAQGLAPADLTYGKGEKVHEIRKTEEH